MFETAQFLARIEAEFGLQRLAAGPEGLQCVSLPAGPVQRQHQLGAETFVERMLGNQFCQLPDEVAVPAQLKLEVKAVLPHGNPSFVQPRRGRLDYLAVHSFGRPPAPQGQGRAE